MPKNISNDLKELVDHSVINQDVADRIATYYKSKESSSQNRLFIVFGILGALLVGLGIVLIIAHNWDDLSKSVKTILAFIPMIIGQAACLYVLLKRPQDVGWKEGTSTFLIFAIGACISLVSQIYRIEGDLASFILTWSVLSLPIIYVMRSSMASMLFIIGITFYASEAGYWGYNRFEPFFYWLLILLVVPHYINLYKHHLYSNFTFFHNWLIPISVTIVLGTMSSAHDHLMLLAYMGLFGLLYLIGDIFFRKNQKLRTNGWLIAGSLGTICLLISLSFDWYWKELSRTNIIISELLVSPEFIFSVVFVTSALALLIIKIRKHPELDIGGTEVVFVLFLIIYFIGFTTPILPQILINILILSVAIYVIRKGAKADHLGVMNYGLLIITALLISRFFDTDLSFVLRGVLFVMVGVGFFLANYRMVQKRKAKDNEI